MNLTVGQIANLLEGIVEGDDSLIIDKVCEIQEAETGAISFLANPKYESHLYSTKASCVIIGTDFKPKATVSTTLLRVSDPYESFGALLREISQWDTMTKSGIEEPAFIGKDVVLGKEIYLGAFCYVGDNTQVGDHVKIYPHTYIGDNCVIEDHSVLFPGVKLYPKTKIGRYCTIQAGAVIGSHGFGFSRSVDGTYHNVPQTGNVALGNHVDIGANTTIDCATIGTTRIADGVKIDNLVQIAHNTQIGEHTVIAALTGISGSVKVGKQVMIGGQVGTVGHIKIADNTIVAARAGVTKDTRSEQILFGVPAIDRNEYLKAYAVYRKLPGLMKRIEELEEKVLALKNRSSKQG